MERRLIIGESYTIEGAKQINVEGDEFNNLKTSEVTSRIYDEVLRIAENYGCDITKFDIDLTVS